jgi:RNA polymerase sigma-70 factor (ECF subfamily)
MDHSAREAGTIQADPSTSDRRTTDREDAKLLERLRDNDQEALAMLYDRYGRLAYGLAYRVVGGSADAEDVVQEAFLTVWRQAHRFDANRGSARSYLMTIVHRRAIDVLRRKSGKPELALDAGDLIPSPGRSPEEFASMNEERDRVRAALDELPGDQRRAVDYTYFEGLTIAEMAEREKIPLGTAKSRLRLALERMRRTMRT